MSRKPLPLVPAICSGMLLGTAFIVPAAGWIAWFALVPLLVTLENLQKRTRRAGVIYLTFLTTYVLAGYWVLRHPVTTAALASLAGLIVLPLLHSIPVLVADTIRRDAGKLAGYASLPAFYASFELALEQAQWGFPWLLLGHSQSALGAVNQTADIVGAPGLGVGILLVNISLTCIFTTGSLRLRIASFAVVLLLLGSSVGYSIFRRSTIVLGDDAIVVRLVQPGIHPSDWERLSRKDRLDHLLHVTGVPPVEDSPDLIVWPESSLRLEADSIARFRSRIGLKAPRLALGALVTDEQPKWNRPDLYNSLLILGPGYTRRYDKYRLVPFAEGVPYAEQIPLLGSLSVPSGETTGYSRGDAPVPMEAGGLQIGGLICFESAFPALAASLARKGADMLVLISQDGWWNDRLPARQHLAMARLRAIETRRSVIHVAATGFSTVVDPLGKPGERTEWMQPQAVQTRVILSRYRTVYSHINTISSLIGPIVSVFLSVLWFIRRRNP